MSDTKTPASGELTSSPTGPISAHHSLVAVEDAYIHSDVFDRLVRGPDDIPGLVAYGIYQIRKREWITEYQKKFSRSPTRQELKDYSFGWRDGSLGSLRGEAEADMFRFAETVMESRLGQMRAEAYSSRTIGELNDLKKLIRKKCGFLHHIAGHVIGFAALVLIAAAVLFALNHEPSVDQFLTWIKSHF